MVFEKFVCLNNIIGSIKFLVQMTFYYHKEDMGIILKNILSKLFHRNKNYSLQNIAITWINYQDNINSSRGYGYGLNNEKLIYPASIVKLVYGLATYYWIKRKIIPYETELSEAVYKMLHHSSNDATSYILDTLTGTTSGPSLEGKSWNIWKYQRNIINDWLKEFRWNELSKFNCCQKTWEDGPFGREKVFYGLNNENRNSMSTDGTAKIMEEIMQNLNFERDNINLKNCLFRELNQNTSKINPNSQIEGFLGEGIKENIPFWSKAGLMSQVRHDAAWWENKNSCKTLLVVFCTGSDFAQDNLFLPQLSKEIYESNISY
tara:strand:- start:2103 stop:3059 length:957 start_codon:yes stop_codon:yes gene_type:complete